MEDLRYIKQDFDPSPIFATGATRKSGAGYCKPIVNHAYPDVDKKGNCCCGKVEISVARNALQTFINKACVYTSLHTADFRKALQSFNV